MVYTLKEEVRAYLQSHNALTLATVSGEQPWAAAVFFVHDDDLNLYFLSDPASRHCQHLEANPRVSATINEDYGDWRQIKGVQLEGTARRVKSPVETAKVLSLYLAKFPFVKDFIPSPLRILSRIVVSGKPFPVAIYRVSPEHLYYLDNAKGFSHREEIEPG